VSTYNDTAYDFQHPWFQTWFYCLAKFLCVIIIFHPDYNGTFGLSPPNVLFPVSPAAFVSATNQKTNAALSADDIEIATDTQKLHAAKAAANKSAIPPPITTINTRRNHTKRVQSRDSAKSSTKNAEPCNSPDAVDDGNDAENTDDNIDVLMNHEQFNHVSLSSVRLRQTKRNSVSFSTEINNNDHVNVDVDEKCELSKEMRVLSYGTNDHNGLFDSSKTRIAQKVRRKQQQENKKHVFIRKKKTPYVHMYKKKQNSNKKLIDMRPISRPFTWTMFCKQQSVYIAFSVLCIAGELLLNISLYYVPPAAFQMLLVMIILFASIYRCRSISRIYHFVGLLFLLVGVIIIVLATYAEMRDANWSITEVAFAISALCIGAVFISAYLTLYQYFYDRWSLYWRLCLTLRNQSIALSSVPPAQRDNIAKLYVKFNNVRLEQETKLIFIHWNHLKFIFMEGLYGLILTTICLCVMNAHLLDGDGGDNQHANNSSSLWSVVTYDSFTEFSNCLQGNYIHYIFLSIFIISLIFCEIILDDARYHLSPYHSRLIYMLSIVFIWCSNIIIHYTQPTPNESDYGGRLSWYDLIDLMGLLFIIGGLLIHDDKYTVFVNKMIEHNDTICEQYKLFKLHEYWHNVYFNREKSRLLGHSPNYLDPEYQSDTEYSIMSVTNTTTNTANTRNNQMYVDIENALLNSTKSAGRAEEEDDLLSIETCDDGKLKGAMQLLLGKDMNDSFQHKPAKYYPAFYE